MKVTPIRQKFGKILRQIRQNQGYSQESLAHKVNLHRTYIGAIERGEQSISLDNLHKLAQALNLHESDFLKNL
ncbi:MAG: helix-turn-helix transcriptional regulator [Candidatus Saccharibacteria bacterium]|nr:helix-turn-helix transcriptional regulator [Candidatus Saccharibacteria bacterium]MCY4088731.1 helix-turn-helix transcriptional regulator [Candidatus Saccharibacteria bacterium]